jgi:DNA-binding transcriptional regulator YiaG
MSHQTFAPNRAKCARYFRKHKEWDVANALGVQVATVKKWEKGTETPDAGQVAQLALFLNFPLSWFYAADIDDPDDLRDAINW